MMLQKRSNAWARLKYAYVLPLAAISVIAFARPEISEPLDEISNAKVSNLILKVNPPEIEKFSLEESPVAPVIQTDETMLLSENAKTEATSVLTNAPAESNPVDPIPSAFTERQVPDTTIFTAVEVPPEFPGGTLALSDYISTNIKYPENARTNDIQGRVVVQFVVEKDGSISNVEVLRELSPELDAEAVRVVRSMPKWTQGKQKGEAVRTRFNIPVNFRTRP